APQRCDIRIKVVGLHTEVGKPAAAAHRVEPWMGRVFGLEGDEFEVSAVGERDQSVVGGEGRMAPAADDGEAELAETCDRTLQVRNCDHHMVDSLEHRGRSCVASLN